MNVTDDRKPRGIRGRRLSADEQAALRRIVRKTGGELVRMSSGLGHDALQQALNGKPMKKRTHELMTRFIRRWSREFENDGGS